MALPLGVSLNVSARFATNEDVDLVTGLYSELEAEMIPLHPMWPKADGLTQPVEESLATLIQDGDVVVVIGEIDNVGFGFMIGFTELLLPHVNEQIGAIRFVFTHLEAREVGVGEAMLDKMLTELRSRGIVRFDAHVLPGHRLVKNFFESGGFSARSIVMHHDDERVR